MKRCPKAIQEVISVSLSEEPREHLISSNVIEISKQAATFFQPFYTSMYEAKVWLGGNQMVAV